MTPFSGNAYRPRDPFALAGAVLFGGVVLAPLLFSLGYAALYSVGAVGLLARGWTGRYWMALFGGGALWASLAWSLYLAAAATAATLVGGLALALTLRRHVEATALGTVLHLPLAFPATAAALVVFLALSPFGTVSRLARAVGLLAAGQPLPNLVHDAWGVGILVAHVGLALPFFALLFVQLYGQEHLDELAAAARSLGAGARQVLWRVTVPVLLRRAAPALLLLFVAVLGSYEIPLLLDRQSPQMLSVLAMRKFALFDIGQKPEAFVVALAYTGLVLGGLGALFRLGGVDA